jgi:hypothetical protein
VNFAGMTADWHPLHPDTEYYGSDRLRFVGFDLPRRHDPR